MNKLCESEIKWILNNLQRYDDDLHAACVIVMIQQRYLDKQQNEINKLQERSNEEAKA